MKQEVAKQIGEAVVDKVSTTQSTGVAPVAVGGGVSAFTICGYPLPDMVQVVTFLYMGFSFIRLLWIWWREIKQARKEAMP